MSVMVGEEYRPPFYGHMFFLGLRDHLISPFTTGYEGTGIESLYPSNTDMLRKAKEQGAVTGYVHPWTGDGDPLDASLVLAKDSLSIWRSVWWTRMSGRTRAGARCGVWSHALNNDLRVTPTGGEDSISNLHISKPVGSLRTYGYLGSEFTASGWLKTLQEREHLLYRWPLLEFRNRRQETWGR